MGGPDGGDGGRGGDVIVRGDRNLSTLLDYTYRDSWTAERGEHGMGCNKTGRSAAPVVLPVPPGTVVRDLDTGELVGEILGDGQEIVVARGGRGGSGNTAFATSTHQAPREWEPGREGDARSLELELKLIADVGLVGQPNAGKSTLLSVISRARPKIADYPFTTLAPNLGVVRSRIIARSWRRYPRHHRRCARGEAGSGLQFLRHIERTRLLALLIPIDSLDWQADYDQLRQELTAYSAELAAKPHCMVFTKLDLLGEIMVPPIEAPGTFGSFVVSAVAGTGIPEMLEGWWAALQTERADTERRERDAALW